MKKILFLFFATLLMVSCKEDTKEQIHLVDYNHSQAETSNDSTVSGAMVATKAGKDSTSVEPKEVVKNNK